jgi:hypothetical protein
MNTPDVPPVPAPQTRSPGKRAYHAPRITDLGDVRELTRGGGGTKPDGPKHPQAKG